MVPRRIVSGLAPAAVLAAVALGIGGCGDDASPSADPADTSTPTEPTTEPTNEPDDDPTDKETLTVDASDVVQLEIEIEDGEVEPTARQVEVNVGTIVLFEVDSDVTDELHIHSAPEEKTFAIKARDDQQFKLTVEQPGQFDVELHESGTLVAQLVVRP
jgi:plastocyanin